MNLRKYAKGQECQIRLPECDPGPDNETVVLCHNRNSETGTGMKEPDLLGAWGCHSCHDIVDGKTRPPDGFEGRDIDIAFFEAILRTQKILIQRGIVNW